MDRDERMTMSRIVEVLPSRRDPLAPVRQRRERPAGRGPRAGRKMRRSLSRHAGCGVSRCRDVRRGVVAGGSRRDAVIRSSKLGLTDVGSRGEACSSLGVCD